MSLRGLRNISFGLLGLITLAMVAATAVERLGGTAMAMRFVYHSPWMIAAWALMAVSGVAYVVRRRRLMSWATMGLHLSFIVILAGAALTFFCGRQGKIVLHEGSGPTSSFTLESGAEAVMAFEISLLSSRVEYYPGTASAMDYVSEVEITCGTRSERHTVAMNRILSVDGFRFYQTALGPGYSTLSVSHDPVGIAVSYTGYCLLFISMCAFFFSRRSRFRHLLKRVAVATVFIISGAFSAYSAEGPVPQTLQRPLAANFGNLYAYWGGRVVPLQTVARDFCMKVCGSSSYRGLTAEQVLTGWIFYYDDWKNEPMIKVKGDEVREILGIEGSYASLTDFYRGGRYRLDSISGNLGDRNQLAADEKVGLVTRMCTGRGVKIFPVKSGAGAMEWLSWVDRAPYSSDVEASAFMTTSMEFVACEIAHGRFNSANEMLGRIREHQIAVAGKENLPSDLRFGAERLYNGIASPWLPAILALAGGVIAFMLPSRRKLLWVYTCLLCCYMTFLLGLRWIIGGHLPMSNGFETMQTMGWISLLMTLIFFRRLPMLRPLGLIVAGLALLVAAMGESNPAVSPLMPVLASPLLSLHVLLVMTSYALFAVMMLDSVVAFFRRNDREEVTRLADFSTLLLYPAVFALGAGIFIGAVWANQSWGRYWGWDPKETWALITFIIYALPLHSASFGRFRSPRTFNIYYFFAFIAVLMTYFGVNYLLSGLHSYAAG